MAPRRADALPGPVLGAILWGVFPKNRRAWILITTTLAAPLWTHAASETAIDFRATIRPILSETCFPCHGPDAQERKADLRLDTQSGLFGDTDDGQSIVAPSQPDTSLLIERVFALDPDDRMPPEDSGLALTQAQKEALRDWVAQGAPWSGHWSFEAPNKPELPPVGTESFVRNPIDQFVLAKLETAGLTPSPEADRERLLRRVTMDLTGLPPSIGEIDAFLEDDRQDAYEQVVERLLRTPAFAERLALEWMDIARYADSHGMHADGYRMMWPWRDWVIEALAQNMPYDQFAIWQLAGDLLPNKTETSVLATAFHRNHPMTAEGGAIDEEFRLAYVFDRAQTTSTAFLGLTMECARCHDHKFDPISQEDFYAFAAYFNNVRELGMTGDDDNYGPMLGLPTDEQRATGRRLEAELAAAKRDFQAALAAASDAQARIQEIDTPTSVVLPEPRGAFPMEGLGPTTLDDGKDVPRVDGDSRASASGSPSFINGKVGNAVRFESEYQLISIEEVGLFDAADPYSAGLWANPDGLGTIQSLIGTAGNKNNFWRGWDFYLDESGRPGLKLIHALPDNLISVRARSQVAPESWTHLAFTYDGSMTAEGVALYVDGQRIETEILYDDLYKTIYPVANNATRDREDRALRVGKSYRSFTGEFGIFKGAIDELKVFDTALTEIEVAQLVGTLPVDQERWRRHAVRRNYPEVDQARTVLQEKRRAWLAHRNGIEEIMVMQEMATPRTTYILRRGQYDQPQSPVEPHAPRALPPLSSDAPNNRLGLAQWLFRDDHPLTARVTVNRYWQLFFGRGLVDTPEDFGSQGALPSHPELLDWLAVTFRESGWDLKALIRTIVTSSVYRQDSARRPDLEEIDPGNRLLARAPSYRLPAELIRDHALAASGLLSPRVGGPSVKPYQPEGLWIEKGNFSSKLLHFVPDDGEKRHRRSLYTFIRRTSPPPMMTAFDTPNRDVCVVRREITNTPMQALVLMNDPQFLEAAQAMATRMIAEGGPHWPDRIQFVHRALTGAAPKAGTLRALTDYHRSESDRLRNDPAGTAGLLGLEEKALAVNSPERAAAVLVANLLMNFDEFYMKR